MVMWDSIYIPSYETGPGDGTGATLADAKIRNGKGICAVQDCGEPSIKHRRRSLDRCEKHNEQVDEWIEIIRGWF